MWFPFYLHFTLDELTHRVRASLVQSYNYKDQRHFIWVDPTLFYNRNASFWKLHFFWGRLYATGPGIIHHFHNALGN